MIYTIGYQKCNIAYLQQKMMDKKIDILVDVRSIPYSRHPSKACFNRNRLVSLLGQAYIWLGDICGGKFGAAKPSCIETIMELQEQGNLMLMCMEDPPLQCHRYYDISVRLYRADSSINPVHVSSVGEISTSGLLNKDKLLTKTVDIF